MQAGSRSTNCGAGAVICYDMLPGNGGEDGAERVGQLVPLLPVVGEVAHHLTPVPHEAPSQEVVSQVNVEQVHHQVQHLAEQKLRYENVILKYFL